MNVAKAISVSDASYLNDYKLEVIFSNDERRIVDFGQFLETHSHPQYNKYKLIENFKKFRIETGNIVWGKNWDLIFPVYDLYTDNIL